MKRGQTYFHIHLVSDSTGETLLAVGRAATAQYDSMVAIEHIYPLVRSVRHIERVIADIEAAPGIVLYTLVQQDLAVRLEEACQAAAIPCIDVLRPVFDVLLQCAGDRQGRCPARHGCRLFQAHRRAELHACP